MRRLVVLDDTDMLVLQSGGEVNVEFEKPLTKVTLISELGFKTLNEDVKRNLVEVKNGNNN